MSIEARFDGEKMAAYAARLFARKFKKPFKVFKAKLFGKPQYIVTDKEKAPQRRVPKAKLAVQNPYKRRPKGRYIKL